MKCGIVWFRHDLRLADHPALYHACKECDEVIPLFIDDGAGSSISRLGEASQVWLYHSLKALSASLQEQLNASLVMIRQADPLTCLQELIQQHAVTHIYWNRCYDPVSIKRDTRLKKALKKLCEVTTFNGALLNEPWQIVKADQSPYKVFTAYWKKVLKTGLAAPPVPIPDHCPAVGKTVDSFTLEALNLLPKLDWHQSVIAHWQVGEAAAMQKLHDFLDSTVQTYQTARDFPATQGTSYLSPHLHFGEISPRQIAYFAQAASHESPHCQSGIQHFLREIGWREFAYSLLFHFPQTLSEPLNPAFKHFQWASDVEGNLTAWQQGKTGIPIVDAGMRELWQTGYMHNRVRMIVASFLTKNLLIPWQVGEAWFRDTLFDADLSNNVMGWQWVAGCGADAAPYFRIFNPVLQSEKFDKNGQYLRQWLPEIAHLDAKAIHTAKGAGEDYPQAMVDLKVTRERALERYQAMKLEERENHR